MPLLMTCFSSWLPSKLISSISFPCRMSFFLIFQRNGALADAVHLKLGLDLHDLEVAEVRRHVVDCFFVGVGERGQAVFAMEQLEGIVVDNVGRRGGEAECDGLEVIEHLAVGVVDGAVAFIYHDEIEEMRRERLRLVPDDVEHRRIRGDVDAAVCGDDLFADLGQRGSLGRCSLKAARACSRKAMRSTRNNTFSAWPARIKASTRAMQVRVLPVPVAITSRNRASFARCLPAPNEWPESDSHVRRWTV